MKGTETKSSTQKIKETDYQDKMGVTSRTEPIGNYQKGQNITVKDHEINNVSFQTVNTVMIYNETIKEVYIDKQEKTKPKSSANYNTEKPDGDGEQEARKAVIMKRVEENG